MFGDAADWQRELERWLAPFLDRLSHPARRAMCPLYIAGLIGPGDRKSIQPMAQRLGMSSHDRLHHFIAAGIWDAAPLEAALVAQANRLVGGSYVSLQSALGYYHLIPEHVAAVTSITTQRPGEWDTPLGTYLYRHIQPDLFYGYQRVRVPDDQQAFIASPAKALLDLVHLEPGGDSPEYLAALRLQNLDQLDVDALHELAQRSGKPKLLRAAGAITGLIEEESEGYERL